MANLVAGRSLELLNRPSAGSRPLLLDHLTCASATPMELLELASAEGFAGICPFLRSMRAVPALPPFNFIDDRRAARDLGAAAGQAGLTVEMAYPFTLTGSDVLSDAGLEAAAAIGARVVNILCFVNGTAAQGDAIGRFAERARSHGLAARLEFFPGSAVRSLADALALVAEDGVVSITCDLLHLYRTGGTIEDMARAMPHVGLVQLCDGPLAPDAADPFREASAARWLPGRGEFDIAAAVAVCPATVAVSVECPTETAGSAGDKARAAMQATRQCLAEAR